MNLDEYVNEDALGLASLLKAGEVAPLELMECAISVAEQRNPAINALCHPRFELALRQAGIAPLKGTFGAVPFLLKDSASSSTVFPATNGSRLFPAQPGEGDSTLVRRFLADGFLPFARTTVPEFCMAPTTESRLYGGPTRNPFDLSRSAGGSSGGAAAAVASGIVPVAHGSDGGGSIRIPASCCGLYGLKTSRGLTPHGPARSEGWGGLAVDGVLSRSVRDTAAALDGIAGHETGQFYAAPRRPRSYLENLTRPFARPLRIARWTQGFDGVEVAPEVMPAVDRAGKALSALGHEVVNVGPPPVKYDAFIGALIDLMSVSVTIAVNGFLLRNPGAGADIGQRLEPAIHDAWARGRHVSGETYGLAIIRLQSIARTMEDWMKDYDFALTPTLTRLPVSLGTLTMDDDFVPFRRKVAGYTAFLAVVNASGQPAASLPVYRTPANLPVGAQLIGHFGADEDVLRLSWQILDALAYRNSPEMAG